MRILDRLAGAFGYVPALVKQPQTSPPYASQIRAALSPGGSGKRGSKMLRNFAENNEWVRGAINKRKHMLGRADWTIVRLDDPDAAPDKKVVNQVRELLRYVNPMRQSLRTVLDMLIEDILVLDAGCLEVERKAGGEIAALWPVDGASISVDPTWNGLEPDKPRYFQYEDFRRVAELKNDELVYMMHNARSHSPIGWSPVETLVRVIEAEIYGEQYDYEMLKQYGPQGILHLGTGIAPGRVQQFREYYEAEIAGTKDVAILGGGQVGAEGPKFIPFKPTNREQERHAYKHWLALKIAFVFEMDLTAFNLIQDVNRATARVTSARTDEGMVGLATLIAEYFTREIVWTIDQDHGFEFTDIIARDELSQAQVDQINMNIGVTFPNEIRARQGLEAVAWGDVPYAKPAGPIGGAETPEPPHAPSGNGRAPKPGEQPPAEGEGEPEEAAGAQPPFVWACCGAAAAFPEMIETNVDLTLVSKR